MRQKEEMGDSAVPDTDLLLQRALRAERANDLHEAEMLYRRILYINPNDLTASINLSCYLKEDAAISLLSKFLPSEDYLVLYNLGIYHSNKQEWFLAMHYFTRVIELFNCNDAKQELQKAKQGVSC